jgi:hypothetical protein
MAETWQEWLQAQRKGVKITSEQIPLTDERMVPWRNMPGGYYGRDEGPFFWSITGQQVTVSRDGQEEPQQWSQPMIKSVEDESHGYIVLACTPALPQRRGLFLLCADLEGSRGIVLRPTLTASKSKLEMQPDFPRSDLVEKAQLVEVPFDGAIFYQKINSVGEVYFYSRAVFRRVCGELRPNERWFDIIELREAFLTGEVGDHLATALAVAALL